MSWRYWSKAVEGDERKKPLDLLSPVVCIRLLVETLWTDVPGWRAPFCWTRRITTGALSRQQPRFMPLSDRRVFGLRSGCGGYNGDSDQNDRSDNHPGLRNADQNCGDRQADNENDESDQVGAERGHDSSWFGFSWLESSKRRAGKATALVVFSCSCFFSFGLPLGESIPASWRHRVVGNLLDCSRDECCAPPVATKACRLLAVRIPDVESGAEHIAAGVVDEVAAEILFPEEDFDVARERENARVGGDDTVTRLTSPARLALHAVLRE